MAVNRYVVELFPNQPTVMEMLEFLVACAGVIVAVSCVALVAKLLLAVVLLPIQLGVFLIKGLVIALCVVPVVAVSIGIAALVPIAVLAVLGLPILIVVGGIVLLIKLLT
jgi:hypothetical protein